MTQTTTELLTQLRDNIALEYRSSVMIDARTLDKMISNGEPLPDQWRRKSDRDVVEKWVLSEEGRKAKLFLFRIGQSILEPTVKLSHATQLTFVPLFFGAPTTDEAYRLAAEWVRGQGG